MVRKTNLKVDTCDVYGDEGNRVGRKLPRICCNMSRICQALRLSRAIRGVPNYCLRMAESTSLRTKCGCSVLQADGDDV